MVYQYTQKRISECKSIININANDFIMGVLLDDINELNLFRLGLTV